ncbi:MAG: SMC-Scp complex subunit ScpB [Parasporobacterium sp.]|nr:SMC-Scp complex subunit ScpB [Parasporobacterium sp.]
MDKEQIKSVIESILFTMGEAVELDRIAKALEMDSSEVKTLLDELIDEHNDRKSGIRIIEIDGSYQMCTPGEAYEYLIRLVKIPKNYKLTDIQLETLSIIAYKQPVTKLEIEKIRGVQSDHAVNRLVEVGLVQEIGRLDQPGRPVLFGTTEEFLRRFGLKNTEDLPEINVEKAEAFKMEAEQELGFVEEKQPTEGSGDEGHSEA